MSDDCPDLRGVIWWRAAREHERLHDLAMRLCEAYGITDQTPMSATVKGVSHEELALYYYLMFWQEVTK